VPFDTFVLWLDLIDSKIIPYEKMKKRRSIRDFEDKDVPPDVINEIIKESCLAPSSANGQPSRFIIVNNKDWIKSLSDESKKNLISEGYSQPARKN
jgi:iodotyrosine deiodinase